MATKKKATGLSDAEKVSIGIGLTAAAVAAAGAYFLYGSKHAADNRKKVRGWTLKAKGEILEKLEKAKAISAEEYAELVETAASAYGTVERATKGELKDFKAEMLEHWKKLEKNKAVKKVVGKAVSAVLPVQEASKAAPAPAKKAASKKAPAKKAS